MHKNVSFKIQINELLEIYVLSNFVLKEKFKGIFYIYINISLL